jgi:putative ATPase
MSKLVECPVCQKKVVQQKINSHLDIECGKPKKLPSNSVQMQMFSKRSVEDVLVNEKDENISQNNPQLINLKKRRKDIASPLADRIRPTNLKDLFGQSSLSPDSDLISLLTNHIVPNLILYGPPGCGKTTTARLIAKLIPDSLFFEYSATVNNIQDIKLGASKCLDHLSATGRKGIIFVDEIHRFSKAQQDIFLQSIERGEFTLVAATTENPSFRLNNALISRCRTVVFHKLEQSHLTAILNRAKDIEYSNIQGLSDSIITYIAQFADGDGRVALNTLEMVVQSSQQSNTMPTLDMVKKSYLRSGVLYDRDGEQVITITFNFSITTLFQRCTNP